MTIKHVKEAIENVLYESNRGILEFTWAKKDADKVQSLYQDVAAKLAEAGITNVDIQPMSQRILVVLTKDQEELVMNTLTDKGFQLINRIFDPSKTDGTPSWHNPTLPSSR